MGTIKWSGFGVRIGFWFAIINVISSFPDDHLIHESRRFKDVPAALNYLYRSLPFGMSVQERCKRYGVLVSMAAATGIPYEPSVDILIAMDNETINEQYEKIDVASLSSGYMKAVDVYRITRLAPPFIDLIECLRQLDTPLTQTFLNNIELLAIVDLYKQVLGIERKVGLKDLDLNQFRPTFRATLKNLFEGYFDVDLIDGSSVIKPYRHILKLKNTNDPNLPKEEQVRLKRVLRQQRYRERHLHRQRERSRLAQKRLRIENPELVRTRDRLRSQRRREQRRIRQGQIDDAIEAARNQQDSIPAEILALEDTSINSAQSRPVPMGPLTERQMLAQQQYMKQQRRRQRRGLQQRGKKQLVEQPPVEQQHQEQSEPEGQSTEQQQSQAEQAFMQWQEFENLRREMEYQRQFQQRLRANDPVAQNYLRLQLQYLQHAQEHRPQDLQQQGERRGYDMQLQADLQQEQQGDSEQHHLELQLEQLQRQQQEQNLLNHYNEYHSLVPHYYWQPQIAMQTLQQPARNAPATPPSTEAREQSQGAAGIIGLPVPPWTYRIEPVQMLTTVNPFARNFSSPSFSLTPAPFPISPALPSYSSDHEAASSSNPTAQTYNQQVIDSRLVQTYLPSSHDRDSASPLHGEHGQSYSLMSRKSNDPATRDELGTYEDLLNRDDEFDDTEAVQRLLQNKRGKRE